MYFCPQGSSPLALGGQTRAAFPGQNPDDSHNVFIFMAKNRKIVKLLHFERGFYVLYEKRPLMGKFKKPLYDSETKSYQISWSDMVYLTESLVINEMRLAEAV